MGQIEILDAETNLVTLRLQTTPDPVYAFGTDSKTLVVSDGLPDATRILCFALPTGKQRWIHRYEGVRLDALDISWVGTSEVVTLVPDFRRAWAQVHDLATGEVKATRPLAEGGSALVLPYFDESGSTIRVETVLQSWLEFLRTYLPMVPTPETHCRIVEMPSGQTSDISWLDSRADIWMYPNLMLTIQPLERDVACWERPTHGPWRWVLGIPAGLGVLIMAASWLLRWRNACLASLDTHPPATCATGGLS